MNTVDRVIRILYKELDLRKYINIEKDNKLYRKNSYNLNKKINSAFSTNDTEFRDIIKSKYLEIYKENYNPDEVDTILRWIENELDNLGYDNYLGLFIYVSKKLIIMKNDELMVSFQNYLEWYGFINKSDYNLYYAAYLAELDYKYHNHKTYILHDNISLYSMLSEGIAENHMHIKGSGYTTDMNWFEFIKEKPFDMSTIKKFLQRKYTNCLDYILAFQKIKIIRLYLYSLVSENDIIRKSFDNKSIIRYLQSENIEEVELLYLNEKYNRKEELKLDDIYNDYKYNFVNSIKSRYGKQKHYVLCERIFLEKLFKLYMDKNLTKLQVYLLNIYILGLNKIKFQFIQSNKEMGFENFKLKENNKEIVINSKGYRNLEIYETVFDNYYSQKMVKYIEFRIAPKKNVAEYIKTINEIDHANEVIYKKYNKVDKSIEKIEYGIIIHYIKCKEEFDFNYGNKRKEKTLQNLKECTNVLDLFLELKDCDLSNYYGDIRYKDSDSYYLKNSKYYKNKIIGIDTANYELNFRPENFGTIYRFTRYKTYNNMNLNFTYHVGEDFNTIANGLRAIDEVIEFLRFSRGDRLGHAIALGLDINKYFERKRGKLTSTIEDYIDDIAWMYQLISTVKENNTELLRYLEDEFSKYKNIYLENTKFQDIDINEYIDSYNLRGDDPDIYIELDNIMNAFKKNKKDKKENFNFNQFYKYICNKFEYKINSTSPKHKTSFFNHTARSLYIDYQFNRKLKENSRITLMFDIDERYKDAVSLCQTLLKNKIYNLDIYIETNPSSNKKISSISRFIELPLLNFNQYGFDKKTIDYNIPISINTDDSAIFQTNLISEYSYVAAALLREGFKKDEIYNYINYLSKQSLEHNFVNKQNIRY